MGERAVVLCLGSRSCPGDGVGWRVAEQLLADPPPGADVRMSAMSGPCLLEEMQGFGRVVIVEAVSTGRWPVGTVRSFPLAPAAGPPGIAPRGLTSALRAAEGVPRSLLASPRGRREVTR